MHTFFADKAKTGSDCTLPTECPINALALALPLPGVPAPLERRYLLRCVLLLDWRSHWQKIIGAKAVLSKDRLNQDARLLGHA